jgi:hypothetical protein
MFHRGRQMERIQRLESAFLHVLYHTRKEVARERALHW